MIFHYVGLEGIVLEDTGSNINIRELNKCRGWWATRLNTRFLCEQDDNVEGTV